METLEQTNESVLQPVQHVRLIFALIIMASFLDIIDFSIVQVALPTIRTQFLATYADLQWVIGVYGLTLAGFLMLMGRAGDVYGQKKIFIAGIVLFTIASMAGAITVTLGTIRLVFGLTTAATSGFDSLDTIVPLGLSVLVLASFLAIESRSKSPLIPPAFLKRGSVLTANTLALVLTSTVGGVSFIITIYLQNILGYSPLYAGLGTLPGAVIFFLVGGWGASRIMNRLGARRTLLMSTSLATVGIAVLTVISAQGSYFLVLPGMIVWTLGASIGFPAVNLAAVAGTKPGEEGLASGVISTSFRIGFPLGLAVLLTIAGAFDPPAAAVVGSYAALEGVVTGFRYALFAAVLLSLLGLALASRIKDVKPPWQK